MRNLILFIFLFLVGCTNQSSTPQYDPVDWNSQPSSDSERFSPPTENSNEIPSTLQILLKLHNDQRELKGRAGLQLDSYLCQYAQKHAEWMAGRNNLKHSDINALMGKYYAAGENIAWNQQNEKEVVTAWMNSPGHRDNIMNRSFTKVGFGVAYNSKGEPYWCTCFGG